MGEYDGPFLPSFPYRSLAGRTPYLRLPTTLPPCKQDTGAGKGKEAFRAPSDDLLCSLPPSRGIGQTPRRSRTNVVNRPSTTEGYQKCGGGEGRKNEKQRGGSSAMDKRVEEAMTKFSFEGGVGERGNDPTPPISPDAVPFSFWGSKRVTYDGFDGEAEGTINAKSRAGVGEEGEDKF